MRRRVIYEEGRLLEEPQAAPRRWPGLDMAFSLWLLRLWQRRPFWAAMVIMSMVVMTGYLTLSIMFGIRLVRVDGGVVGWLTTPSPHTTQPARVVPVSRPQGH